MATINRYRFSAQELRSLTGWPQRVIDDYTKAQDEAFGFEEEIATIQFEIDQLQSDVLEINNEINTINVTIDEIQFEIDQLQSDVLEINNEINTINVTIDEIQTEVDQLQSDVVGINGEINTINVTIDEIQTEVDQNTSDIQQNAGAIADLESGEDASTAILLARKALSLFDSIDGNELEDHRIQVLFRLLEEVKVSSEDNAALAAMVASQQKRISTLEELVASLV